MEMWERDPKKLMMLAKGGDKDAFGVLYELFFTPVFRYLYFRMKNKRDAEDITQAVFLKVYKSVSSFEDMHSEPLAYFFTVARNALIDYYRKGNKILYGDEYLEDGKAEGMEAENYAEKKEISEMVCSALRTLPPETQEAITLKFINEMENKEIANLTGKSEDAVRQLHSRGLKILREYFRKNNLF